LLEAAFVLSDSPFDVSFADESLVAAALTLLDDLSPVVSGFGGSAVEPVGELLVPELTPDVDRPPLVAALAFGSWPEGGVLGRPDGVCA